MDNYVGFIYLWTCDVSGKKYLGSHKGNINDNYLGSGVAFKLAIKKYGIQNFKREIIEFIKNKEDIQLREQYWLDFYNVANNNIFYNISGSASGGRTLEGKTKEEMQSIKEKMSKSQKNSNYVPSQESLNKMSEASKKWWSNKEVKETHSNRMKNNSYRKGKLHTKQTKKKIKESIIKYIMNLSKNERKEKYNAYKFKQVSNGKKVIFNGKHYNSIKEFKDEYNISYKIAKRMIMGGKSKIRRGSNKMKSIIIDGIKYDCIKDASDSTGLSLYKLRKLLK